MQRLEDGFFKAMEFLLVVLLIAMVIMVSVSYTHLRAHETM
jgi:hypothetical protein